MCQSAALFFIFLSSYQDSLPFTFPPASIVYAKSCIPVIVTAWANTGQQVGPEFATTGLSSNKRHRCAAGRYRTVRQRNGPCR
ncbi:exported hypothetical protein [uncultured Desulfovibrio sp.]|uniref:Uncharacterized protein n=1 Tax=uncultured Desulfovibrio sp. TaxID=167968 RepID=A0A212JKA9_9BACT|nr:exported hypothetical protein [uncultured Desulfovibrio sp.]